MSSDTPPPSQQLAITLAYDGTPYLGWQKTQMGPSVEGSLTHALEQLLQEEITLEAASRTDAGVHARKQVATFFSKRWHQGRWDGAKLRYSLDSLLPDSIAIIAVDTVAEEFHPTLSCQSKEYHYHLNYSAVAAPHERFYCWHYPARLDLIPMRRAAEQLVGTHHFAAFCNTSNNPPYKSYVRTLYRVEIVEEGEQRLIFIIKGNHFLYKMVRNIVGTLLYLGCDKLPINAIPALLARGKRTEAGITAPAHGLSLHSIDYGIIG